MGAAPPPPCKSGDICSEQFGTVIDGTNLYFATATTLTSDGGGVTTLNYWNGSEWKPSATSTNGGTWTKTTDSPLSQPALESLASGDLGKNATATTSKTLDKEGVPKTTADKVVPNSANAGTDPNNPSTEGSETLTADQEADANKSNADTRKEFSKDLYYPITLKSTLQDILKIDMVEYKPTALAPSSLSGFAESGFKSNSEENVIGTVHLPIPAGISDSNGVSWQSDEINPIQSAGVNFALTGVKEGFGAAADVAGQKAGAIQQNTGAVQTFIQGLAAGAATNTGNILSRTKGIITNPNMELLFSAPQLRQFAFTYKLSSRSKDESEMIRSIIRFFKQGMAVRRSAANLFLQAPYTFKLSYRQRNEKDRLHIYLNKFKECALTNFSVDYTPEGQYATFQDGAMVSYQITLQFQELEPIFNDDYGKENQFPDPDIGY